MSVFESKLRQARRGGGILFCGAGFTADCLNFESDEEVGAGHHLLQILNSKLKSIGATNNYKNVQNAAAEYMKLQGENGLMSFLKERFDIKSVTEDMVEILRFPWSRVYTTNYDNGVELGLRSAGLKPKPINNLDDINEAEAKHSVVHLHGYIHKWDINTFRHSCVLDSNSYMRLDGVFKWLTFLRNDIHKAEIVVFVGFNASDFHLNQAIYDVTPLREKIYFINRPSAEPDPDVRATQELFGTALYEGRRGFADRVKTTLASDLSPEPRLVSFRRHIARAASADVPKVDDIEGLFVFGRLVPEQLARDLNNGTSEYHIRRGLAEALVEKLQSDVRIALITGDVCDGKTLTIASIAHLLSALRPVFELHHPYEGILDEVASIIHTHPNSAFVIENCFDLRADRLLALANMCRGSAATLLLSSRSIASEAEPRQLREFKKFPDFSEIRLPKLGDAEARSLVKLADQIAGWREFRASSEHEKLQFIKTECNCSIPAFQLRLLRSPYVIQRYREEYNKSGDLSKSEKFAIIMALYIGHVGHDVPTAFLSDTFNIDVAGLVDELQRRADGLRLIHRWGSDFIRTVPSIGATNILEHMVPDSEIVDAVVATLKHLASLTAPDDFERHMFGQLMRYSIMKPVVGDKVHVDRFFDNISKVDYFRRQVLFWLQWHIAKIDQEDFLTAEKYLDNAYAEADAYERRSGKRYDRKQLDDRTAKFLMQRAQSRAGESSELFREMREAWEIVGRLLKRNEVTHHPFNTMQLIAETFSMRSQSMPDTLRNIASRSIIALTELAEQKKGLVPAGYQYSQANEALMRSQGILGVTVTSAS